MPSPVPAGPAALLEAPRILVGALVAGPSSALVAPPSTSVGALVSAGLVWWRCWPGGRTSARVQPGSSARAAASHPRVAPSRGSEAQTGEVISVELAQALRAAGLVWSPAPGDHFAVPERDLDGQVFVISDIVISQMEVPGGPPVLAFNGTTEWALDSLDVDDALWLPREDQLRELIGPALVSLERLDGATAGWVVTTTGGERHVDTSAAAAYARAVLGQAGAVGGPGGGLSGGPGGG